MIRPTDRDSLIWEIERARQPKDSTPSTRALVVLAVALALLVGVAFRLIDQWVRW